MFIVLQEADSRPQNDFPGQGARFANGALLLQLMGEGGLRQRKDPVNLGFLVAGGRHQPLDGRRPLESPN